MALLPHRSVRDNVAYPLEIRGETKARRWNVSQHTLSLVGLDGFEDRFPKELSGGMQQRASIIVNGHLDYLIIVRHFSLQVVYRNFSPFGHVSAHLEPLYFQ